MTTSSFRVNWKKESSPSLNYNVLTYQQILKIICWLLIDLKIIQPHMNNT